MDMKSLLLVVLSLAVLTAAKRSGSPHYRPFSVGMNVGTPFDLTNTLQNVVAGPFVVILTSIFGLVLLAGILAPHIDRFIVHSGRSTHPSPR